MREEKKSNFAATSVVKTVPTVSSTIDPKPHSSSALSQDLPKLDLDTLRANVVQQELSRKRSPTELQQERNHRNQSLEARLEKGAKEAEYTDCRTAYAQTGLLAPLFIAADLVKNKGCQF